MHFSKNKISSFIKKTFGFFLALAVLSPSFAFAEVASSDQVQQLINEGKFVGDSSQKQSLIKAGYTFPSTSTSGSGGGFTTKNESSSSGSEKTYEGAGSAVAEATGTCSVGQILANLIGSTVATGINSITSSLTGLVSDATSGLISLKVPVMDSSTNKNTARLTTVKAGGGDSGSLINNFLNGIGSVSLDSIAFCIANEMIKYIGESTISWIKSGFKGNPVFVDNPEKFFTNIADQEAGTFIKSLVASSTGIDVCQPFKVQLVVGQLDSYNSSSKSSLGCSLDTIKNNYQGFTSGDSKSFSSAGIPGWFELIQPQNNYWGAKELARSELNTKVSAKKNTATIELNWTKGYKNFKICKTSKNPDGTCKKNANGTSGEDTVTLGNYIEHTVNARATSPQNRLEIAQTFDGVVSALVNELVKIAVNKMFDTDSTDDEETLSAYCESSPSYPKVGERVTWSASAYGGDGSYSYSWSGDASGSASSVSTTYSTQGQKSAVVVITSDDQEAYRTCYVQVYPATTSTTNPNTGVTTPTISSISPASGQKDTVVTIYGSNFNSNSIINFEGAGVSLSGSPESASGSTLTFRIPSTYTSGCSGGSNCTGVGQITVGTYQISVENESGRISNSKNFTVTAPVAPSITSISPTSGPRGTDITITGTGFDATGNLIKMDLGSGDNDYVGRFNSSNGTSITFTVPSKLYPACVYSTTSPCYVTGIPDISSGTYAVSVESSSGVSNTRDFTVTGQ